MSLNSEPCMVRLTLIDSNPVELKYYPFMFSLDKCSASCNSVDDLSIKICVPSKTKDVTVKVFNIITNWNQAKILVKHIPCDCKCKLNSAICNSNLKWNNETCQCEYKNYHTYKNDYSWNPSKCICENGKYLKSIADDSKIVCDVIICVIDIVITNASINSDCKKLRYKMDCYNLHTVLLVIILPFIIAIICYHHATHGSRLKNFMPCEQYKNG